MAWSDAARAAALEARRARAKTRGEADSRMRHGGDSLKEFSRLAKLAKPGLRGGIAKKLRQERASNPNRVFTSLMTIAAKSTGARNAMRDIAGAPPPNFRMTKKYSRR